MRYIKMEVVVLSEFKNNMITFFDELIDQFPDLGELVIMRIFLKDQICIKDVIEMTGYQLNKNQGIIRKMIKDRNEEFFLEENNFFDVLSDQKKNKFLKFSSIWRSKRLDKEDKETIWKWIDSFVFLTDKYNKLKEKV
jgi:hypothetical protein